MPLITEMAHHEFRQCCDIGPGRQQMKCNRDVTRKFDPRPGAVGCGLLETVRAALGESSDGDVLGRAEIFVGDRSLLCKGVSGAGVVGSSVL